MYRRYMKLLQADGAGSGSNPVAGAGGDPQAGSTPNSETPQAGNPNPQAGTGTSGGDDEQAISLEKARELRSENKGLRTRLNDLEKSEAARQQSDKDAADKKAKEQGDYQKLLTDRETELATERANNKALALRYEAVVVAQKLGIAKPDIALRLIDPASVEYDATTAAPTNLETLFKAAIEELPALATSTGTAVPGSPNRPNPSGGSDAAGSVKAYHDQMYGPVEVWRGGR